MSTTKVSWERFQKFYHEYPSIGLTLDLSRVGFTDEFLNSMRAPLEKAHAAMLALENGAIANADENRMVGHYWLRNSSLAPSKEIQNAISETIEKVLTFSQAVHAGSISGSAGAFRNVLLIGIGGSALGPQLVHDALGDPVKDRMQFLFLDNTDPDGMDRVLARLGNELGVTLVLVVSKSGGTKETRNGMLEVEGAYQAAGLVFSQHAVAVTGANSELDRYATENKWIDSFPMWDWVGGRTSELSAVGLLPAALQGLDIKSMLEGATQCDQLCRSDIDNPASKIARMWFCIGNGTGCMDMVVLPYKDRLQLFSKYLQQLVMESLGKELDRAGKVVNQGLAVYGNKGSTDQHAYVQQLRDGLHNFFVLFIRVAETRTAEGPEVEPGIRSGDYLNGFLFGTRKALADNGRASVMISVSKVDAFRLGVLIALFERAVGLYAELINVNAYHQPGVEAGKRAATEIIAAQHKIMAALSNAGRRLRISEIAEAVSMTDESETVFHLCEHLVSNRRGVAKGEGDPSLRQYWME